MSGWVGLDGRPWGGMGGEQDAGDHQGNKCRTHPPPTALAPTAFDGLVLSRPLAGGCRQAIKGGRATIKAHPAAPHHPRPYGI